MSQVNALQLTGISKSFDGFKALIDADFTACWGKCMRCWAKTVQASPH